MRIRPQKFLIVAVLAPLLGCGSAERPALLEPPYGAVAGGLVRASEVWPVGARAGRVVVTDQGQEHDARDVTVAVGPGVWRMSVGGFWVTDVVRDDAGGVSALKEVESAEERRLEYDPPLPLLPAELRAGEPIEFTSAVSLYNHANGALEATGECTATYTLLGKKTLSPGGILPGDAPEELAYIVRVDRRYKLPLVGVDMRIVWAYAPGRGPIAGRTVRVVKLLGLLPVVREQSVKWVQ